MSSLAMSLCVLSVFSVVAGFNVHEVLKRHGIASSSCPRQLRNLVWGCAPLKDDFVRYLVQLQLQVRGGASNSVCLTCELHNHDCKRNHDDRRPPPFRRRIAAASTIVGADADIAAIVTYQIKTGKRRHWLYSTPLQNYPHGDAKHFRYGSGETAV